MDKKDPFTQGFYTIAALTEYTNYLLQRHAGHIINKHFEGDLGIISNAKGLIGKSFHAPRNASCLDKPGVGCKSIDL